MAAKELFDEDFKGRVLHFDASAAKLFAQTAAECRLKGYVMSNVDAQIAAIAQSKKASLVTRNVNDFTVYGLQIINPWQAI